MAAEEYVELDETEETEEIETPISYKLNSFGIDYDVSGLVRRQNSKSIYLPDFQRRYVWSKKKASRFIESLLLGLPIPSVCLYKDSENKQIIIDGFQRLESIRLFYSGNFSDGSVFKLIDVDDAFREKTINDLDEEFKLKLDDTLIHATVVKADEPQEKNYNAVYSIFERLNTGGVKLTSQEIRACVFHGPYQEILERLSQNDNFKSCFKISSTRKKDHEVVLRLMSLDDNYENYSGNMNAFLNDYMDSNKKKDEASVSDKVIRFNEIMCLFRQLPMDLYKPNGVLNLAIVDAIYVGTSKTLDDHRITDIGSYAEHVKNLLNNKSFEEHIQPGTTHHSTPVKERIKLAIEEIKQVI